MQPALHDNVGANHLRVVFAETVRQFELVPDATLIEVARTLTPVLRQRFGEPLDIRVVLAPSAVPRQSSVARPL